MYSDYNCWINTRERSPCYRAVTWRKLISTRLTEMWGMALSLLPFLPGSQLGQHHSSMPVPAFLPPSRNPAASRSLRCPDWGPRPCRIQPSSLFQFLPQKQPSYRSLEFCFLVLAKPGLSARQLRKQALFGPGSSEQPLYTWVSRDC